MISWFDFWVTLLVMVAGSAGAILGICLYQYIWMRNFKKGKVK